MSLEHALMIYVDSVPETVAFFEKGLGIKCRFMNEMGYALLEQEGSHLGLAEKKLMDEAMGSSWKSGSPDGFELIFTTEDVKGFVDRAIKAGAKMVAEPSEKFWSKEVAYVKSPQGILIQLRVPNPG